MTSFLDAVVFLAQLGAVGVVGYGLVLCLRADAWLIKALRTSRGEGVQSSHPAHLTIRSA
jgi:hypothetical protein